MKKYLFILLPLFIFSCQKEEITITQDETETSFLADGQLTGMVKSVASHDGTFDDLVDQCSCYSLNFPYQVFLNGSKYEVNGVNDLLIISKYDTVTPIFPVTATFTNYYETEIVNEEMHNSYISRCEDGLLYDERITCVDFTYPVRVSVYDTSNNTFETITFNHDKETFTGIELFETGTLASINYPIRLELADGTRLTIESNAELKEEILLLLPVCQ